MRGMEGSRHAVKLVCLTLAVCLATSDYDHGRRRLADSHFHHASHKTKHPKGVEHCHMKVDYTNPEAVTRDNFEYDIVITSGLRRQYGSTLASTLATMSLAGLTKRMRHLHIVLSTPEPAQLSLIHNLGLYHQVKIHVVYDEKPPAIKAQMVKGTYYRALRVSDDDCLDNTPTLIIEDDVLFSSNMDQKIFTYFKSAVEQAGKHPHVISLYIPDKGWPGEPNAVLELHKSHRAKQLQADGHIKAALWQPVHAKRAEYWWCAQALLYPTGDVRRALAEFYSPWRQNTDPEEWQDWPIRAFLHQENHTKIWYFEPEYWSLVQHVGRSSTLFGASKSNWKFTHAPMFDFDEKFVADDPPHMWF